MNDCPECGGILLVASICRQKVICLQCGFEANEEEFREGGKT